MSIGYCGYGNLIENDSTHLLYTYCCYNLNDDRSRMCNNLEDGEIIILADCLVEPDIHNKIKKLPSGRKKMIQKRIPNSIPLEELINQNKIIIKNASGTWKILTNDIDMMALRLVFHIFHDYQETGKIPEHISCYC